MPTLTFNFLDYVLLLNFFVVSFLATAKFTSWYIPLFGETLKEGLAQLMNKPDMAGQLLWERKAWSKLTLLSYLGSASPFIGLSATILHIIVALQQLPKAGKDISKLALPLSDALYSTLFGIVCALLAMLVSALFIAKTERSIHELNTFSSKKEF